METAQPGTGGAAPDPESSPSRVRLREPYDFEGFGFRLFQQRIWGKEKKEEDYLPKFVRNLGLDEKVCKDQPLLREFVAVNHLNAAWYARRVEKERLYRWFYITISIALVAGLPIVLAYLPKIEGAESPEVVVAQLTGAVTGLIALQNVLGSVFGQRQLIGQFWKARTELAEQVYNLETKWRLLPEGGLAKGDFPKELKNDLKTGIENGRRIVAEETQTFFDAYAWPTIDVGSLWTGVSTVAQSLTSGIVKPPATAAAGRRAAESEREAKRRNLKIAKTKRITFEGEREKVRADLVAIEKQVGTLTETEKRKFAELREQEVNLTTKINALTVEITELIAELAEP